MSFVKIVTRQRGGAPLTGVSVGLHAPKKGRAIFKIALGDDVLKARGWKIGDRVAIEVGYDEHEGQVRIGKDAIGRKLTRYGKSDTARVNITAWRAFAVREAPMSACEAKVSRGMDEPDRLVIVLPAHWFKAASVPGQAPAKPRDVTDRVLGPNGNGGRR